MGSSQSKILLVSLLALALLAGSFAGGLFVGWTLPGPQLPSLMSSMTPVPAVNAEVKEVLDVEDLFEPFWDTWDVVHEDYVDQPLDDEKMMQGAIRGMMESLGDQHTSYMDPDQWNEMNIQQSGEYEGIGAWVDLEGDYIVIISPMPGSPAEEAGLRPNDIIVGVDGEDVTGIDGNVVLNRILGPAGSKIILTISRESEIESFEVEIIREKITIPSVEGEFLEESQIAYIHIFNFGDKTTDQLMSNIKELMAEDPVGMIVDLRGNGGGYVHTTIEVVSQFIEKDQVIMIEEYGDGTRQVLKSRGNGLVTDIPLVVLVNEGTASASEIMAGVVQDYDRGVLVGMKTFGKGSVQSIVPLVNAQGAIRVTVARWLTPNERHIHEIGLDPDYVVEFTEEDFEAELDPQMDKAIELLTSGE